VEKLTPEQQVEVVAVLRGILDAIADGEILGGHLNVLNHMTTADVNGIVADQFNGYRGGYTYMLLSVEKAKCHI